MFSDCGAIRLVLALFDLLLPGILMLALDLASLRWMEEPQTRVEVAMHLV